MNPNALARLRNIVDQQFNFHVAGSFMLSVEVANLGNLVGQQIRCTTHFLLLTVL